MPMAGALRLTINLVECVEAQAVVVYAWGRVVSSAQDMEHIFLAYHVDKPDVADFVRKQVATSSMILIYMMQMDDAYM